MSRPVVVVATDLSPASERGFGPAASLARGLGADLVLVHVVQALPATAAALRAPPLLSPSVDAEVDIAKQRLQELLPRFGTDARVTTEVLVGDDVAATLTRLAEERGAAYLVVTTHGRSGLRRLVLGSVAEAVLRKSPVPVVVVPM
jgi:nucleotide-binding universal stress UspA family protein